MELILTRPVDELPHANKHTDIIPSLRLELFGDVLRLQEQGIPVFKAVANGCNPDKIDTFGFGWFSYTGGVGRHSDCFCKRVLLYCHLGGGTLWVHGERSKSARKVALTPKTFTIFNDHMDHEWRSDGYSELALLPVDKPFDFSGFTNYVRGYRTRQTYVE
jgi:hypothetical protein